MSSNKASKQPKLTDKGRVSEELAPISDQPKPVVVDSFRRNAPTPRAPATREQTLSQMTLTQLGAQLPEEDHAVLFEQSRAIGEDVVQPTAELRVEHEALPPLKRVEYLQKFRLPVVSNRLEIERHQATRACPVRARCAGAQARGGPPWR